MCTRIKWHVSPIMIDEKEQICSTHWRPTWNVQATLPKPLTDYLCTEIRLSSVWSVCKHYAILIYKIAVTGLHFKLLSRSSNCAQMGFNKTGERLLPIRYKQQ